MTTGNVSTTFDSFNYSTRVWNGANSVKGKPRTENAYTLNRTYGRAVKCYSAFWTGSAWIDPQYSYLSGTSGRATLLDWGASPNLELQTWSKLAEAVKGNQFNTGIFLSQLPMAVDQLVGIAGSLLAGFHALKHGNIQASIRAFARAGGINTLKTSKKTPRPHGFQRIQNLEDMLNANYQRLRARDISSTWLALQYGVLPTLADISDLVDFIASYHEDRKVVVRAEKTYRVKTKDRPLNTAGFFEQTKNLKVALKASFVENPPSNSWLGHFDPFGVLWELAPWSFVVDWVIPIGTFLESTAIFRGLSADVTRSTLRSALATGTSIGANGISGGSGRVWSGGSVYETAVSFKRDVHLPLAVPLPMRNRWSRVFSLGHLENGAALVDQSVRAFHR